ncbi:hypothetical protein CANCADRAFT_30728 [Tortispora caseinolytica NRRL Y-17796]|uniref:ferric-chelate reductase (NADPH) n=1 Tax=Tortispora caseinolytica NRRL Y-17796 TaxID=767744 RepID=A0A1E4TLK8_9ASCO|nr:hypothetical protein CANCADRAFT_30728 [Tortispora caseinolytica NRRL Y-17796]
MKNILLVLTLAFVHQAQAVVDATGMVTGCFYASDAANDGCYNVNEPYGCSCTKPEVLGSAALCVEKYKDQLATNDNSDAQLQEAWSNVLHMICFDSDHVDAGNYQAVLKQAQEEQWPMDVTEQLAEEASLAAVAFWKNQHTSKMFAWGIMIYFAALVAVSAFVRAVFFVNSRLGRALVYSPYLNKPRGYVSMPPTIGSKRAIPWNIGPFTLGSVLQRGQTIILLGYLVLIIVSYTTAYPLNSDNMRLPTNSAQWTKYLGDRAGIIAVMHLPLVVLFSGRNNILSWATSWSFDFLNVLHRWTARGMWVSAVIHAGVFTHLNRENYPDYQKMPFFMYALSAVSILSAVLFFSMYSLRHAFYEFFSYTHFVLVLVFLVMVHQHVKELRFTNWVYVAVGFWAFDRLMRVLRILWAGVWLTGKFTIDNGAVKVTLRSNRPLNLKPGSYVFLHVPRAGLFQSHPFSVCEAKPNNTFTLVIKPMKGMTNRLEQYVRRRGELFQDLRVWIDGTYGHTAPVEDYDNVLVIAGGVGVTGLYGYLETLKLFTSPTGELVQSSQRRKNVQFIWAVHSHKNITWANIEPLLNHGIEVQIYVTNVAENSNINEKQALARATGIPEDIIHYSGRPDLDSTISSWVQAPGSAAILTCGPPAMNDACRNIVARNLRTCKNTISYYEESFAW